MTTIAPEPVVEVGDGLSARWNTHVKNVPSHLSITNEWGELIGRVFADTQAEAWAALPARIDQIVSDREKAEATKVKAVEEDVKIVSKAKDEAIKRILARRTTASDSAPAATSTAVATTTASATNGGNA